MNLRDLSAVLGLSQTTVSRALNGFPEVSEETRSRVKSAADLHGYRPSAAARRLATGKSGTLGVVFPRERNLLGDLRFTEFLSGVVQQASEHGYDITLAMTSGTQNEESVYRRTVRTARVDGMILSSPTIADPRIDLLRQLGMPFVLHGRTRSEQHFPFLDVDNESAFFQATKLLTDLGHKRIALLNGEKRLNYANDRDTGYHRALVHAGLSQQPYLVREGHMNEDHGASQARQLLADDSPLKPTAFLCSSISQAEGVARVVRQSGLRIGKDISLIAHDDRLQDIRAETFDPPLTATQSSIGDAGKRAVEILITHLREPSAPCLQEIWPIDLVMRASTGPVATKANN